MVVIYRRSLRAATAVEGPSERRIARPSGARGDVRRLRGREESVARRARGRTRRHTRLTVFENTGDSHCTATAIRPTGARLHRGRLTQGEAGEMRFETEKTAANVKKGANNGRRFVIGDEAKADASRASS
eukprot:IDg203t1